MCVGVKWWNGQLLHAVALRRGHEKKHSKSFYDLCPRLVPSTILVIPSKGALLLISNDFTEALKPKNLSMWMSWRCHSRGLRCCVKTMLLCHAGRSMGQSSGGFQPKFSLSAQKMKSAQNFNGTTMPARSSTQQNVAHRKQSIVVLAGTEYVVKVLHTEHWHAMWLCDVTALVYSSSVCCRLIGIVPCISFAMIAGPRTCRFGSAHSYSNETNVRCNGTEFGHSCEFLSKLGASFLATGGQGSARHLRVLWLGKLEFRCKAHKDLVWKMFGVIFCGRWFFKVEAGGESF